MVRLTEDIALILTTDFFTPIVDDPFDFGRIAASNSLSDVYAMGGEPLSALNIVGFPEKTLPRWVLKEILRGGQSVAAEAGIDIVGGHTLKSDEPIYGLAVTGTIHPDRVMTNGGAKPGDCLVLTKPLGSGLVTTAYKGGNDTHSSIGEAIEIMIELNRAACEAMMETGANASTDVTGFGLLGHLVNMLEASHVGAEIDMATLPLITGAADYLEAGYVCGGSMTNWKQLQENVAPDNRSEKAGILLSDAQTSGGLLIAVSEEREETLHQELAKRGVSRAATIGRITADRSPRITLNP